MSDTHTPEVPSVPHSVDLEPTATTGAYSAPTFVFNPPTHSLWLEAAPEQEEQLPAYSLHRIYRGMPRMRKHIAIDHSTGASIKSTRYYVSCTRGRCYEEREVYRVVTGTHTVPLSPPSEPPHTQTIEDFVYYWPDDALVVEKAAAYGIRTRQYGFCSYKCLSLWAAKVARDMENT